jgi:protein-S-isoprenylcysteine O-methyltransferase Ste14
VAISVVFTPLREILNLVYEEPTLERKFGQSYLQYKASVNRWLPGIL